MNYDDIENLNKVDLYELLNLDYKESNQTLIKDNFSKLIKIFHSDKGGKCEDLEKSILNAYKILSDVYLKLIYDNFGFDGLSIANEDTVKLKIVVEIIRDPNSSSKEIGEAKRFLFRRINKKLSRRLEDTINRNQLYYISNSELSQTIQIPLIESIVEKDKVVANWVRLKKNSIQASFPLVISEDQKNKVFVDTKFEINNEKKDIEEDITFTINKTHTFPFQKTLFNQKDFEVEHEINFQSENFITYTPKFTFKNFLYNNSLSLLLNPSVNYNEGISLNEMNFGLNTMSECRRFITSSKVCPLTKTINSNLVYRPKNDEKIVANITLAGKMFTFAGVYFKNMSKYHSYSRSLIIRNGLISFGNDFLLHKNNGVIELKSNLNMIKQNGNFMLSSIISVVFKISRFKITIPIIVSSVNNPYTLLCFGLSTIIGNSLLFIYNSYKKYFKNRNRILDQKCIDKQIKFNENNKYEMEVKLDEERKADGLIINYAYFGEKETIEEIYKNINILGQYRNINKNVFDIRPALILAIHESKLVLPKNIISVNGVYSPRHNGQENLYYVISYKFRIIENTIIIKNGSRIINLP